MIVVCHLELICIMGRHLKSGLVLVWSLELPFKIQFTLVDIDDLRFRIGWSFVEFQLQVVWPLHLQYFIGAVVFGRQFCILPTGGT